MKRSMARETLLAYPDFNIEFHIHTDESYIQLGAVISREGRNIAFYSRNLNPAQTRYTVGERGLLSIVEVLKEFRNILLGQQVVVHTDHTNLSYKTQNSDRVMLWRLYIEEYSPDLCNVLPLGKSVTLTHYVDANLYHDMLTGRSVTGILHMLNQTPIDSYSKFQGTVETATYGSEFVAARTCVEQVMDLRHTLRYLGVPLRGKS